MDCLIDTGATCNLVSESYYKENPVFTRLRSTKPKFNHTTTANGTRIAIVGFLNVYSAFKVLDFLFLFMCRVD